MMEWKEERDSSPDASIRKIVKMISNVRAELGRMPLTRGQRRALDEDFDEIDRELGWAAWQIGQIKTRLRDEREAREELEEYVARPKDGGATTAPGPETMGREGPQR